MTRPLQWFLARVDGTTLFILALFELAMLSVAWGLAHIVRGLDFELLETVLMVGAVTGWLLARSSLRGSVALLVALTAAVVTVFVRVGQLGASLLAVCIALAQMLWRIQFRQFEIQSLLDALALLREGLVTLGTRLTAWGLAFAASQPNADLVASALVWSFLLWLAAAWAAWMLRRKINPFFALLPLLLLLALLLGYSGYDILVLVLLLVAFLVLMVVVPHLARQRRWERERLPTALDLGFDLAIVAVPAIAGIVAAAVLVPAFSPTEIAKAVQRWTQPDETHYNAFSDSLGVIPAPRPTTVFDSVRAPGLPRSHLIGAPPELLHELAFSVETDDPRGASAPYYWLNTTYDVYTGRGWISSNVQTTAYGANEPVPQPTLVETRTVHQTVDIARGQGLVYAAGTLVSVDHDFQVAWRANQDLFAAQVQANPYRVESRVQLFTPDDLRAEGTNYPAWIQQEYLALPQDMPPRVLALARDLTAAVPTPYDRARAIETYLHTIPYTLDLPAPPPDHDVADYFLFDLRKGYCDYYATAMTVLARAAGLPARVAVGYASGTYDASTGKYMVTEADAHSWSQIYFPDYGWIDFEPTTGRANPGETVGDNFPNTPPVHGETDSNGNAGLVGNPIQNPVYFVPGIALLVVLGLVGFAFVDSYRLQRLPSGVVMRVLYQRLWDVARHLGLGVTSSDTPMEVAQRLQMYFESPARPKRFQKLFHSSAHVTTEVVQAFVQTTYGAHLPESAASKKLLRQWLDLRGFLWLAMGWHFVSERVQQLRSRA